MSVEKSIASVSNFVSGGVKLPKTLVEKEVDKHTINNYDGNSIFTTKTVKVLKEGIYYGIQVVPHTDTHVLIGIPDTFEGHYFLSSYDAETLRKLASMFNDIADFLEPHSGKL